MTDLLFFDTKQPPVLSVVGSGATALHALASDEGYVVVRPEIPDTDVQVTPDVSIWPSRVIPKPEHQGMDSDPDLKSPGLPKKSQRSARSPPPLTPCPLKSF